MSSVDLNNIFKYDKIVMNLNNQNCLSINPNETCFYVNLVEPIKNIVFVKILRASITSTTAINASPLLYKKHDPIHLSINDYDRSLSYLKSVQVSTSTNILKSVSNLFQTTGANIYKPINSVNDGVTHTETITQNTENLTLKFYDSTITTSGVVLPANSKFMNIFSQTPSPTRFMTFSDTDYLVYYNSITPTESRFVKSIEVVIENVASPLTPENNTFSNTCPLMVNWLGANNTAVPTDTANIVAGLYIAKPPITSFNGVNLSASNASHPLMNCRLYYSQIIVQPEKSIKYIEQNRNKKVVYRTFCSSMYPNIAGS
jgi:hypothetical protein